MNALNFNQKVVLVTGGNSGIGRATALYFSELGAHVIISGRSTEKNDLVVKEIQALNGKAISIACDISQPNEIKYLFEQIKFHYGCLDIAINNAGIEGQSFTKIADYPDEIWDSVIQTNLSGTWHCLKQEILLMLESNQGGAIVNVASLAGLKASLTGGAAYTASKHGIIGLTKATAREYASKNIRVNAVCPGLIKTPPVESMIKTTQKDFSDIHPIGRLGAPSDIASAIGWLSSEQASFITGIALPIDGGLMA